MNKDRVAVVDEEDRVITIKARDKLTSKDIVRVAVLWLENSKGQALLQQRSFHKKIGPGQWGPAVAGTVESHETYQSNIVKEAAEELGLTGVKPVEVGKRLYWEPDGQFGRMFMFYKDTSDKAEGEFTIAPDEVEAVKWVDKSQILADIQRYPERYVPSVIFWQEMYY